MKYNPKINDKIAMLSDFSQIHPNQENTEDIQGILEEENLSLTAIIKLTVYVIDLNNFSKLNEVFEDFFIDFYPARSAVEVSRLHKDSQVEIEAICSYEN